MEGPKIEKVKEILVESIQELGEKRPIFHSEADFQHSLAVLLSEELRKKGISVEIRLEKRMDVFSKKNYVDLYLEVNKNIRVVIELKYKTKAEKKEVGGEKFDLLNQGAQDLGGYFFFKDIRDLEELKRNKDIDFGFCIFLTNDSYYWDNSKNLREAIAKNFRIKTGTEIRRGPRKWIEANRTDPSQKKKSGKIWIEQYPNLELLNYYPPFEWKDYSKEPTLFKYLLVEI